ncbi:MAG TPA: protein kinase [Thermoanaerobaculia bacterium]|nr:protein kinase [Thermoanaerobaculia bacterium]
MPISSGSRLGPYEVVAPIGAGGMGEVWRARDTRLDRSVAVKVLPAELAKNAQLKLRFEREAKAISQLNHPNICQLYDVGDDYLVMELIEGESLADRIGRGPLPLDQVLRYGTEIADALDKAHRSGIIHRDLKPGNVMVAKSGAKLLDFGLASIKPAVESSAPHDATAARSLTQEGTILGTFQYMAPEQLEGLPADARTDIFALGCVLYEMLTGRRAFEGKNRTSLIAAIVSGTPRSISELQPLTPPALEHIVHRCLAKDPDDRWQSAHDVAEDLRWIRDAGSQAGIAAPVAHRRKLRLRWLTASAAAVVVAALAVAGYVTTHRQKPVNIHFTLPGMTDEYMAAQSAYVSPDGTRMLIGARSRKTLNMKLWIRPLDGFDTKPLDGTDNVENSCWSPDGRAIAFIANGKLQRLELSGGTPRVLATIVTQPSGIAWSGDSIVWGEDEGSLKRVSSNGGPVEVLTKPDAAKHEIGHVFPTFLPGGKRFLFITYTRNTDSPDRAHTLYAGSLGSSEITRVGSVPSRVQYYDGYLFFVRDASLYAQSFDAKSLKFTGEPKPVLDDVFYFQPTGGASFAISDAGMISAVGLQHATSVAITDLGGRELSTILSADNIYDHIAVAPDASRIYVARVDPKIGTPDIWEHGLTRPTKTRLTFDPEEEAEPVVSPDGKHLYYESDRYGVPDIFEKRLDGSSPDVRVVAAPNYQAPWGVSPDGRFLSYTTEQDAPATKTDLWMMSLADRKSFPFVATPAHDGNGAFSPDGRWIVYLSDGSGAYEVYLRQFPNGKSSQVTTIGVTNAPRWSRDGRKLYFTKHRTLYECDVAPNGDTSDPRPLFEARELIYTFELMPDGKRFVLVYWSDAGASPPIRVISRWSPAD